MWQRLDELIKRRIGDLDLVRGLLASGVCAEFDRLVTAELGEGSPVRAVSFREGRLKVEVGGGVWASEVRLRLPEIQRKLNKRLRDAKISEIKLVVR